MYIYLFLLSVTTLICRNENFFAKLSMFKNEKLLKVLGDLDMVYPSTTLATFRHYIKCFVKRKVIPMPRKQTFGKIIFSDVYWFILYYTH